MPGFREVSFVSWRRGYGSPVMIPNCRQTVPEYRPARFIIIIAILAVFGPGAATPFQYGQNLL